MAAKVKRNLTTKTIAIATTELKPNQFSLSLYGDPRAEIEDLLPSVRDNGILVPLVIVPGNDQVSWEVISGHRRLACAHALRISEVLCEIRHFPDDVIQRQTILEYNRQRRKTFTQLMREADALEELWGSAAAARRLGNLRRAPNQRRLTHKSLPNVGFPTIDTGIGMVKSQQPMEPQFSQTSPAERTLRLPDGLLSEARIYTDKHAQYGSSAQKGDIRAQKGINQLDAGTKTIHAAYKDLRRRNRYSCRFSPYTLRHLAFSPRWRLWNSSSRRHSACDRCPCALLFHSARGAGARSYGGWWNNTRCLLFNGAAVFSLRSLPCPSQISKIMTFATDFLPKEPDVILSSATLLITLCLPDSMHVMGSPPHHYLNGFHFSKI